jgi:hypothetical protein
MPSKIPMSPMAKPIAPTRSNRTAALPVDTGMMDPPAIRINSTMTIRRVPYMSTSRPLMRVEIAAATSPVRAGVVVISRSDGECAWSVRPR